jgi:hypothetical protein
MRALDKSLLGCQILPVSTAFDLYVLMLVGLIVCFRFDMIVTASTVFLILTVAVAVSPLILLNPRLGRWFIRKWLGRKAERGFRELGIIHARAFAFSALVLVNFYLGMGLVGLFCFLGLTRQYGALDAMQQ